MSVPFPPAGEEPDCVTAGAPVCDSAEAFPRVEAAAGAQPARKTANIKRENSFLFMSFVLSPLVYEIPVKKLFR